MDNVVGATSIIRLHTLNSLTFLKNQQYNKASPKQKTQRGINNKNSTEAAATNTHIKAKEGLNSVSTARGMHTYDVTLLGIAVIADTLFWKVSYSN